MMVLESCLATQSWVNREYKRGLSTHPLRGPSVKDQRGGSVVAYSYHLGVGEQVQEPVAEEVLSPRVLSLVISFVGTMALNAELYVVNEQHSHIGVPFVQVRKVSVECD